MKDEKLDIGDIFLNPMMGDLWFLNKVWDDDEQEEVWMLNLINADCQERFDVVVDFVKIGNIYDWFDEKYGDGND